MLDITLVKKLNIFLCKIEDDTDRHLLECVIIKMSDPQFIENSEVVFDSVYSTNMTKVKKVSNMLIQALRIREIVKHQENT